MPTSGDFKLILVGDSGVGKTTFIIRFADGWFKKDFECTLGVDYKPVLVDVQGTAVGLKIWDTAGQERFRSIINRFYRETDGVILMFDVTKKASFDNVPWWLNDVRKHCPSVPIFLVGNKCEDTRNTEVLEELAQEYADENQLAFYTASAKTNKNVSNVFLTIAAQMLRVRASEESDNEQTHLFPAELNGDLIDGRDLNRPKKRACCSYFQPKAGGFIV